MNSWHIHITGQVQGVGFRPFVFRLAQTLKLSGWVSNQQDGVHIEVTGPLGKLEQFEHELVSGAPLQARIEDFIKAEIPFAPFKSFHIADSLTSSEKSVRISPDFGMCDACREDLENPKNSRYQYAFTTCTNCGPRYSILSELPYDRPTTTMATFKMCKSCQREYDDPMDRRFFSQTNSCPDCAIHLELFQEGNVQHLPAKFIPNAVSALLQEGKIGAIKGIGGYLLVCDATNPRAIERLRRKKRRPHKPLAVMFRDRSQLEQFVTCSDQQFKILKSPQAPILLLSAYKGGLPMQHIAPGLNRVGAMLPYAPLYDLILFRLKRPIIATSGNISGSPIVYTDHQALKELTHIADFVLANDREILVPQDDSVLSVSDKLPMPIILRRSRGYAPCYYGKSPEFPENWLALGAQMKGAFAFSKNNQLYISQYLGNMESYDSQQAFRKTLNHLTGLTDLEPEVIFTDKHPGYFSHQLASKFQGKQIHYVQHHEAHFASLLMEHDLLETTEPLLGVIWDGTGLGKDGNIWGGEFMTYNGNSFSRVFNISPVNNLLGEKMSREPRVAALAHVGDLPEAEKLLEKKFSELEWLLYQRLNDREHPKTTSMGRLFDAVSSLLELCNHCSFEGQAAMLLEAAAERSTLPFSPYSFKIIGQEVDTSEVLAAILKDVSKGQSIEDISSRFHDTLVEMIRVVAYELGISRIGFSGGVFQNLVLCERIQDQLRDEFHLHFHDQLSPNDENIAAGQLAWGYIHLCKESDVTTRQNNLQYETSE